MKTYRTSEIAEKTGDIPIRCAYILVMLSMLSISFMIGGIAPDPKKAGVAASLLYFPMLIFSGTTLPYEILPQVPFLLKFISGSIC